MSRLLNAPAQYKPFHYPWAYEAWLTQQRIHWLPEEVPLGEDVKDWNGKLSEEEKNLLTQIFRFFTQSDIEVNSCYMKHYSQVFKPTEVLMMLAAFSNMETIHIDAYSQLLDTLGMPDSEYAAFHEYQAMQDKHDFFQEFGCDTKEGIATTMAIFAAFVEGMQLFASFAILLNFPRFNKMKGMGQIITWSVRDETLHMQSVVRLFHEFIKENPEIWTEELKQHIIANGKRAVETEDAFIDLAFEMGGIEGLEADEVKQYIRFIADRRFQMLELPTQYGVDKNPLPWVEDMLNQTEFGNFFETRVTDYTRDATEGDWNDAF
jgi:ribonucleoside-diphosphate reductase beta chain